MISIFLIVNFSVSVFALSIDECKMDIYFGNGVWNTAKQAKENVKALEERIIKREIVKGDPALQAKYGEVKLQYNWGGGTMIDVLETYYQLKKEGQVNDLEFFMVMMIITGGNAELSTYATGVMLESMPFIAEAEQENVDMMMQKYYNESFRYSHRVLLVSHSQGNMFANRVFDSINPSGFKEYFANVQVASPASSVHASVGDYVTGFVDPIINQIPGSMESNADLDGFGGHTFVEAYLDSSDTYTKIVDAINTQLGVLDTIDSQWTTDQELDKGTCNYRITVKHRFDPALEIGEKVYPFAANQKLYTATNQKSGEVEYVKATCGGSAFTDAWDGKKENECWMIDNPFNEKIIKQVETKVDYFGGYGYAESWCDIQEVGEPCEYTVGIIYKREEYALDQEPFYVNTGSSGTSNCSEAADKMIQGFNIAKEELDRRVESYKTFLEENNNVVEILEFNVNNTDEYEYICNNGESGKGYEIDIQVKALVKN